MKKYTLIAIIAIISGFSSCTKEDSTGEPGLVTFNIQTEQKTVLRAAAPVVSNRDARYIVEVWNETNTTRIERYVQLNNPTFSFVLDKVLSYNIAVWVDYVIDVDDSTPNPSDYFYVTTDFKRIVLNSLDGDPDAFDGRIYQVSNLPARDAFTGVFLFTAGQAYPTTLQVKRPLARINVIAADAGVWKDRPEIGGNDIILKLSNPGFYTFNALTQVCVQTGINIEYRDTIRAATYNAYPDGQSQTVLSGLYLSNVNSIDNISHTSNFDIHWKVGTGTETVIPFLGLPFKRNYKTNITGGLIFNLVNFEIDADSEYEIPDIDVPL